MSTDCIFFKIANKEISSNFIYEDENDKVEIEAFLLVCIKK